MVCKVRPMNASELYGEGYFMRAEGSNYVNYSWQPALTIPMARSLVKLLEIEPLADTLCDIGCARGYLCKALRMIGVPAFGYDISAWAIANCDPDVKAYVSNVFPTEQHDFFFLKDLVEHVPLSDLSQMLSKLTSLVRKAILIIVPLSSESGGPYVRREDNMDSTHLIRWPLESWMDYVQGLVSTQDFIVSGSWHWPGLKPSSAIVLKSCGFVLIKRI